MYRMDREDSQSTASQANEAGAKSGCKNLRPQFFVDPGPIASHLAVFPVTSTGRYRDCNEFCFIGRGCGNTLFAASWIAADRFIPVAAFMCGHQDRKGHLSRALLTPQKNGSVLACTLDSSLLSRTWNLDVKTLYFT